MNVDNCIKKSQSVNVDGAYERERPRKMRDESRANLGCVMKMIRNQDN